MAKKNDEKERFCSFCGKSEHEVDKLITGSGVYICNNCVALCNQIIKDEYVSPGELPDLQELPKPTEIKAVLDQYVIGQESAKKILSVALYNHMKILTEATGYLFHDLAL